MGSVSYEEISIDNFKMFVGEATPYEDSGDKAFYKSGKELTVMAAIDGVSNSASASKSSRAVKDFLEVHFKNKRTFNFNDFMAELSELNHKMHTKELASTLSLIVINNDQISVINIGDSQVYLELKNGSYYESLTQNVGFSKDVENKDGHILLNWLGSEMIRAEVSYFKQSEVVCGLLCSDGLNDLVKKIVPDKSFSKMHEVFPKIIPEDLHDDVTCIEFVI